MIGRQHVCGRLGVCSLCLPVGIDAWTNTVDARPSLPTRAVLDRTTSTPWVTAGPGLSPTEAQIKPSFTPLLFSVMLKCLIAQLARSRLAQAWCLRAARQCCDYHTGAIPATADGCGVTTLLTRPVCVYSLLLSIVLPNVFLCVHSHRRFGTQSYPFSGLLLAWLS